MARLARVLCDPCVPGAQHDVPLGLAPLDHRGRRFGIIAAATVRQAPARQHEQGGTHLRLRSGVKRKP
jgi:hypothetical protein